MIHKKIIGHKMKLTKASLTIVLLLSLFSFAGLNVYHPRQKQITKTELVSSSSRIAKRTHSVKRTVVSFQLKIVSLQLHEHEFKVAILHHARFIKTRFNDVSAKVLCIRRPFDQSHIPLHNDEDDSYSTRG
jgi:hypothetical protein